MGWLGDHRVLRRLFVLTAATAAVAVAALLPLRAGPAASTRDVVLVVRDMAFYLEGDGSENPTLRFRAGEQVRLVLRNEQTGVTHDFAVHEWQVATRRLHGRDADAVSFTVPERAGRYEYVCNPHSSMMRGVIEVE